MSITQVTWYIYDHIANYFSYVNEFLRDMIDNIINKNGTNNFFYVFSRCHSYMKNEHSSVMQINFIIKHKKHAWKWWQICAT